MHLTDEHTTSFQSLYSQRFGKEISKEEAREKGAKLLRLMELVYKPITQEEFARVQERKAQLAQSITKELLQSL